MTKPVKSIFDKSYIVEAQAIKAGEKEWSQGYANISDLTFDAATKKYRWVKVADAIPADELPANVDLGQALAESGESLDDLKDGDAKANASMGLNALKPRLSSCIRPTKLVWDIADCMPKASRKEVMEECVRQGVAYGTARTQYQAWFKASQEALRGDIRQPYEKGTK